MARGKTTRQIEFADLSLRDLKRGVGDALLVISSRGKGNKAGRAEYSAAVRHREVNLCAVGALALYLFQRFHVSGERFPGFTERANWYHTALIRSTKPTTAISASAQQDHFKQAMDASGIISSKATHFRRHSACVMAEAGEATEKQIRRAGRCNQGHMEQHYLTTIPTQCLRVLTGYEAVGGDIGVLRSTSSPSLQLQRQVFPDVELWQERLEAGAVQKDKSLRGFLSFCSTCHVVLQDSILLMQQYPSHNVWKHRLFQSGEYEAFRSEFLSKYPDQTAPYPQAVGVHSEAHVSPSDINEIRANFQQVHARLGTIEAGQGGLQSVLANGFKFVPLNSCSPPETVSQHNPTAAPRHSPSSNQQHSTAYTLSRKLTSVEEVRQEYATGLIGKPSVKLLEETFGARWRTQEKETRFFSRRKQFYDEMKQRPKELLISQAEAATILERKILEFKQTLNTFRLQLLSK